MSLSRSKGGGRGGGGGISGGGGGGGNGGTGCGVSVGGTEDIVCGAASTNKRGRSDKIESPPRGISESSPRTDTCTSDDRVYSGKTPRFYHRISAPETKKKPKFEDDYELGEMLKEGAEGQAYICYKKHKFQGDAVVTFTEKKFVVKKMNLEDVQRKSRFMTWEKLLQIKRGQSEIMMANVQQFIVRHLCSYEDEEAHELYGGARLSQKTCAVSHLSHVHRDGILRWRHLARHNTRAKSQGIP